MGKNNLRKITVYERATLLNAITRSRRAFEEARDKKTTFLADWEIDNEIENLKNIEKLLSNMYIAEE